MRRLEIAGARPAFAPEHRAGMGRQRWVQRDDGGADALPTARWRRQRGGVDEHVVEVHVPDPELGREVADGAGADVEGQVASRRAEGEEKPRGVVGTEQAHPARDDGEEVVNAVVAGEDAGDAGTGAAGAGEDSRRVERPRERSRVPAGRAPARVPGRAPARALGQEGAEPEAPRLADEGHAAAVGLARDEAKNLPQQVVGEVRQGLGRRRGLGLSHWGVQRSLPGEEDGVDGLGLVAAASQAGGGRRDGCRGAGEEWKPFCNRIRGGRRAASSSFLERPLLFFFSGIERPLPGLDDKKKPRLQCLVGLPLFGPVALS